MTPSPARRRRRTATLRKCRFVRARTLLYAGFIAVVGAIMLAAFPHRTTLEINVLHERNPPYVLLSDGSIRNGYTVKILNKRQEPREFRLGGGPAGGATRHRRCGRSGPPIRVDHRRLRELRVLVTVAAGSECRGWNAAPRLQLVVHRQRVRSGSTTRTTISRR